MISSLPVLPVIFPMITAAMILLFSEVKTRRLIASASSVVQVAITVMMMLAIQTHQILIMPMGGWAAPFGIMLTVDSLSAIMVLLTSIVSVAVIHYSITEKTEKQEHPLRLPLIFFCIAGITLSFVTGDLFNLFVAFEIMLIASYALLTLEIDRKEISHAYPYLAINIIGSALFLCAAGLTYSLFGSLNFADIAISSTLIMTDPRIVVIAVLFTLVFGMKAGFFPLYYWLPNSYPKLPAPVGALFAALLTKVGIYALLRIFGTMLPHQLWGVYSIILLLAIPTMILGAVGALERQSIREILSFNLISHIGIMMVAIGLFTQESIAALIYYIIHHVLVIASLFLLAGLIEARAGSGDLKKLGNIWKQSPILSFLFLIQALSLAGIPPLSGFWGKWMLISEALGIGAGVFVAIIVITSVLSLWSLLRIITTGFWTSSATTTTDSSNHIISKDMVAITLSLVLLSLLIGLSPNSVIKTARRTSQSLFNQFEYTKKVMEYRSIRTPHYHTPKIIESPIQISPEPIEIQEIEEHQG